MVIADVPPFLQCPQVSPFVSFVTGMSDAPSPATNAGLILIWLQRRAVSPPRLSLALAPCVAHRHRSFRLSSTDTNPLACVFPLSSISATLSLFLSLSSHHRSRSLPYGPHSRIVGWHGIPCGTTPFRRSLVRVSLFVPLP